MLYNKEGEVLCGICGDYWSAHGLGGNCNKLPMNEDQRAKVLKLYLVRPPKAKIQEIVASVSR